MARVGEQRQLEATNLRSEEFKREWKAHEKLTSEVFEKNLSALEKSTKALLGIAKGSRKALQERGPEYLKGVELERNIRQGAAPLPRAQDPPQRTFLTRRGPPFSGHQPQNPQSDPARGFPGFYSFFESADDITGKFSVGVADAPEWGADPIPADAFNYPAIGPCDARKASATIFGWPIPVHSSRVARPLIAGFRAEFCVDPVAGSLLWPESYPGHGTADSAAYGFVGAQADLLLEVHDPDTQQIIASTDKVLMWSLANYYGGLGSPPYGSCTCSQGQRAFVVETSFLLPGGIRILTPWVTLNVIAFRAAMANGNSDPNAGSAAITCGDSFLVPPYLNLGGAMYLCDIVAYTFDPSTSV